MPVKFALVALPVFSAAQCEALVAVPWSLDPFSVDLIPVVG